MPASLSSLPRPLLSLLPQTLDPTQRAEHPGAPLIVKPNITAPKQADGCPGCGRSVPGAARERYCMMCDKTF
jgi:hypothetical protein